MQGKANAQVREPQKSNQGRKPVTPGKDGMTADAGQSKGKENGWRKGGGTGTAGKSRHRAPVMATVKQQAPESVTEQLHNPIEHNIAEDVALSNAFSADGPYLYGFDQFQMLAQTNADAAMQAVKQAAARPGMMQNMNLSLPGHLPNVHPMAQVMPVMSVNGINGLNGNANMIMAGNMMMSPFNGGMITDGGYYSHISLLNFQSRGQQVHPNGTMMGVMHHGLNEYQHAVGAMPSPLAAGHGLRHPSQQQHHPHSGLVSGSGGGAVPSTGVAFTRSFNGTLNGEIRTEDILKASSPILTRCLVDMLREGEAGKLRARRFFERIVQSKKADVYQYSVMLNACANSYEAEALMNRMDRANIKPSEVTYQKLYKIYLRDARVEEAERVLEKMRRVMRAEGNAALPDDYTNRVLTDMLLEMVKEGDAAERRAWELFNKIRCLNKANVIHYNVMLNTCRTTEDALKLLEQAREAGIEPSDRTCCKLAKMYIKEGCLPSHPGQLEAVMKGLKKTHLFGKAPPLEADSREFVPGRAFVASDVHHDREFSGDVQPGFDHTPRAGGTEAEVARLVNASILMLRKASIDHGSGAFADGTGGTSTSPPAAAGPPSGLAGSSPEAGGAMLQGLREGEAGADYAPLSGPAGPH